MALLCGQCGNDVEGGFGFLYRLGKTDMATLHSDQYTALPNVAICDGCWENLPERVARASEADVGDVFCVYIPTTGETHPFNLSISCLGNFCSDMTHRAFVSLEVAERYFSRGMQIIQDTIAYRANQR